MCEDCKFKYTCEKYDMYLVECEDYARDTKKIEDSEFLAEKFCIHKKNDLLN